MRRVENPTFFSIPEICFRRDQMGTSKSIRYAIDGRDQAVSQLEIARVEIGSAKSVFSRGPQLRRMTRLKNPTISRRKVRRWDFLCDGVVNLEPQRSGGGSCNVGNPASTFGSYSIGESLPL